MSGMFCENVSLRQESLAAILSIASFRSVRDIFPCTIVDEKFPEPEGVVSILRFAN